MTTCRILSIALCILLMTGSAWAGYLAGEVSIPTDSGRLFGELLTPDSLPPHPAAVIVAGEGPVDRDGNSAYVPGGNDGLRLLAEALAERGVAVLRYDKRGVGKSASALGAESELSMERLARDAAAASRLLQEDERFPQVVSIGHGQGGLVAMLAADILQPAALVLLNAQGLPGGDVVEARMRASMAPEFFERGKAVLEQLEAGKTVPTVAQEPVFLELFRPEIQPYLISWFKLDPAEVLGKLTMPVLIVQGTTDVRFSVEHAQRLHLAGADSQLAVIDGMNHVFKQVPLAEEEQRRALRDPRLPLAPQLADIVWTFIEDAMQDTGGWSK